MKNLIELLRGLEIGETLEITEETKEIISDLAEKEDERKEKLEKERAKRYEENKPLFDKIISELTENPNQVFTAGEIAKLLDISTQKASSLLRALFQDEKIEREKAKTSSPFVYSIKKIEEEEEEE